MGLKGITMNTAAEAEPHIYAEDDAAIYQAMFGEDGVLTLGQQFAATVLSNNKVRVADGILCVGGHIARTPYGEYDDVEIANGQSGVNRNDIIVAKIVTTGSGGIDTISLEVKQGTAASTATDPALTQEDIYQGGKIREYPLYRVVIEGLSITAVETLFTLIPTIPDLKEKFDELNSNIGKYLPLTGGTLSGNVSIVGTDTTQKQLVVKNSLGYIALITATTGTHGLYSSLTGTMFVGVGSSGVPYISGLKEITLNNAGKVEVSDSAKTWLTLRCGSSGVNVKDYSNPTVWRSLSASSVNQTSSKLIKENIEDITEEEAKKLLYLRPVSFDFRKEVGGQKNRVGMIAEEMLELYPHSVVIPDGYDEITFDITKDMPLTVDYVSMIPYLIKMIQIQQKEIESLKE